MSCGSSSELYCSPSENAVLYDNQTYAFEYNSGFSTLAKQKSVDIYLYHPDTQSLFQKMGGLPNNGEMTFSIDDVS
jgi:hypothetical protein